ncbi:MAG: hypothetical protein U0166_02055 [Acidobacteriota bacterium]
MATKQAAMGSLAIFLGTAALAAQGGGTGGGQADVKDTGQIISSLLADDETTITTVFSYDSRGRRDPFEPRNTTHEQAPCGPGVHGMRISELDLQGIVLSGDERYALVEANDKGYNLREGDTLCDGVVKTIEKDRVTFYQKNTDPLDIHPIIPVVKKLDPIEKP